ncbi:MAG: apolipoprotein N-acyltransferase [Desulfuromonas sp.]|nr:MAG: apolipoprotein N-acyltransferase [Desulfuromonas sp.]
MTLLPRMDRTLLASSASGLLLALAFPAPDWAFFAWFALVPLLLVKEKRPFASGFWAGIGFFTPLLYWLNIVMTTYGQLQPVFSLAAHLMLVAYLSLFFAAATWCSTRVEQRLNLPAVAVMPLFWVGLEYLRGLLLSGFPWGLVGYSQHGLPWMTQAADLTGVYGVSALLLALNCTLAEMIRRPRQRLSWLSAGVVALLLLGHLGYGAWRYSPQRDERPQELTVGLIQGNIDQALKWAPGQRQQTVELYRRLSMEADASAPGLIIWPEAAVPFYLQDPGALSRQVRTLPTETDNYLLVGAPAYDRDPLNDTVSYYNSAYLFSPQGVELGRSDKIHLVPFGEYVPLSGILTFVNRLVVGVGDFSPGTVRPLSMNGSALGVLVCYEAIFPELARDYVSNGSDLLVNITNDAWFGHSPASEQLLAMTRFRAIENRIWIARAANTGISALVAPSGRVTLRTPMFETLQVTGQVGLGAEKTFYTRFGDLLPLGCLVLCCLLLVYSKRTDRRRAG